MSCPILLPSGDLILCSEELILPLAGDSILSVFVLSGAAQYLRMLRLLPAHAAHVCGAGAEMETLKAQKRKREGQT